MVPRTLVPPGGRGLRARRHLAASRHRRVPVPARLQVLASRDSVLTTGKLSTGAEISTESSGGRYFSS